MRFAKGNRGSLPRIAQKGLPVLRYRWTTGGDVIDCIAPWRAGAAGGAAGAGGAGGALRTGFFGAAGLVVVAVGLASAGAPAAGWASSAGSTVSFWICFSRARSL